MAERAFLQHERRRMTPRSAVAVALLVMAGCLSDEALRLDCTEDGDCPTDSRCTYHVCVSNTAFPLRCEEPLTPCGGECVDTRSDADNCGACFEQCRPGPDETAICAASTCNRTCASGRYDVDPDTPGCEYECQPTTPSVEACDQVDNDCDGLIDEEDPDLATPACDVQDGVCRGSRAMCSGGEVRACAEDDYADHAGAAWEASELRCDGLDNDCDGRTDERCCTGAEPPFEVVEPGDWSAARLGLGESGPALVSVDGAIGTLVTFAIDEVGEPLRTNELELTLCGEDEHSPLAYIHANRALLFSCASTPGSLRRSTDGEPEVILADETGVVIGTDAVSAGDSIAVAARVRDDDGSERTLLATIQGASAPVTASFAPPTDDYGGVSVEFGADGVIAAFATRSPDEVRLQPLDDALAPRGFPVLVSAPSDWPETVPLVTDTAVLGDGRIAVAHPGDDGGIAVSLLDGGESTSIALDASIAETIDLREAGADRLHVTTVSADGIRAFLISTDGEILRSWSLPIERDDSAGGARVHVVSLVDGDVLFVAYGSPRDLDGPVDGLVVHRLGFDSSPLCE